MKKYSVPMYFVIWVDVEAEDTAEAQEKALDMPFRVEAVWYGSERQDIDLNVEFTDMGDVYDYEDEKICES